jgi:hypothetical protein
MQSSAYVIGKIYVSKPEILDRDPPNRVTKLGIWQAGVFLVSPRVVSGEVLFKDRVWQQLVCASCWVAWMTGYHERIGKVIRKMLGWEHTFFDSWV